MTKLRFLEISGKSYPLVFTFGAVKRIADVYGDFPTYLEIIKKQGARLNFRALIFGIELLIAQGCAYVNYFYSDIPLSENLDRDAAGMAVPAAGSMIADSFTFGQVPDLIQLIGDLFADNMKPGITAHPSQDALKNGRKIQVNPNNLTWFEITCREIGMTYREYHLLTLGEIQDLAIGRAIRSGAMVESFNEDYIPDLR